MADVFYFSAEARWFLLEHKSWELLLEWFKQSDRLLTVLESDGSPELSKSEPRIIQERIRTDEYLLLPSGDTVGVKQRQGRLEVKAIVAGPQPFCLADSTGRKDWWVKWSFRPSDEIAKTFAQDIEQAGPWHKVEKERYLQKYSLESGNPTAVVPTLFPMVGCNIELTKLFVGDERKAWITFGFEAFGPPSKLESGLRDVMETYLTAHGPPPVPLAERDSLSYPSWIAMQHNNCNPET